MLVAAPEGFDLRQPCLLRREVLPDLTALIAAAHAAGVTGTVQAVSCYRSAAHQRAVFFAINPDGDARCLEPEKRAMSVAPPSQSEHSPVYPIDFGTTPYRVCHAGRSWFDCHPLRQLLLRH